MPPENPGTRGHQPYAAPHCLEPPSRINTPRISPAPPIPTSRHDSALPPPPSTPMPWWQRLYLQFTNVKAYQRATLGGHPVASGTFLMQPSVTAGNLDSAKRMLFGEMEGLTTVGWPYSFGGWRERWLGSRQ